MAAHIMRTINHLLQGEERLTRGNAVLRPWALRLPPAPTVMALTHP